MNERLSGRLHEIRSAKSVSGAKISILTLLKFTLHCWWGGGYLRLSFGSNYSQFSTKSILFMSDTFIALMKKWDFF